MLLFECEKGLQSYKDHTNGSYCLYQRYLFLKSSNALIAALLETNTLHSKKNGEAWLSCLVVC